MPTMSRTLLGKVTAALLSASLVVSGYPTLALAVEDGVSEEGLAPSSEEELIVEEEVPTEPPAEENPDALPEVGSAGAYEEEGPGA